MGNYLKMEKQQQIQALTALGWTDRAIGRATGIYRATVAKYRKTLGVPQKVPLLSAVPSVENQPEVPTVD